MSAVELVVVGLTAVAVGFFGVLLAFWSWGDKDDKPEEEKEDVS